MKNISATLPKASKRRAAKAPLRGKARVLSGKTVTFKVSSLTRPWAVDSAEGVIRALSGDALSGAKVKVEITDKPKKKTAARS